MAKSQPLTVIGFLNLPDGSCKRIEELTAEERARWDRERTARMKRVMTDYFRAHPDEFLELEDAPPD